MDPAPLPGRSRERLSYRGFESGVSVGDDQHHPVQAPLSEAPEEGGPEHFVLAVAHVKVQYFPVAVCCHPSCDHNRPGDDSVVFAAVEVGGVDEHVRELDVIEGPVPERGDFFVELLTDPRHRRLGDPRRHPQSPH